MARSEPIGESLLSRGQLHRGRLRDDDLRLLSPPAAGLLHLHHLQLPDPGGHLRLPLPRGSQFRPLLVDHFVLAGLAHAVADGVHGPEDCRIVYCRAFTTYPTDHETDK